MSEKIQPIKPEEILEKKIATIPDGILKAVNELIALKWNGHSATIKRCEVFERYFEITNINDSRERRDQLLLDHALDFEFAYRNEGWYIQYNKPGVGDSDYEPYYFFEIRK